MATKIVRKPAAPATPKPELNAEAEAIVKYSRLQAGEVVKQISALKAFCFSTPEDDSNLHHFSEAIWTLLDLIEDRAKLLSDTLGTVLNQKGGAA
jgi:hypothetical protein